MHPNRDSSRHSKTITGLFAVGIFLLSFGSPAMAQTLSFSPASLDVVHYGGTLYREIQVTNSSNESLLVYLNPNWGNTNYPMLDIPAGATETATLEIGEHYNGYGDVDSSVTIVDINNDCYLSLPAHLSFRPPNCVNIDDVALDMQFPYVYQRSGSVRFDVINCTSDWISVDTHAPQNMPWILTLPFHSVDPFSVLVENAYIATSAPSGYFSGHLEVQLDGVSHFELIETDFSEIPVLELAPQDQVVYVAEGQDSVTLSYTISKDNNDTSPFYVLGNDIVQQAYWSDLGSWTTKTVPVVLSTASLAFGTHDVNVDFFVYPDLTTIRGHVRLVVVRDSTYQACLSQSAVVMSLVEGISSGVYHVSLINCGDAPFDYTISSNHISWLADVSPTSGSLSSRQEAHISLRPESNLTPGTYSDVITVQYTGGNQITLPLIAHVVAQSSQAQLSLGKTQVNSTVVQGGQAASSFVSLSNLGGEDLNFAVSENLSWLRVSPENGSLAGGTNVDLVLNYDSANLAPGFHSGTITVNSDGGVGTINVGLVVSTNTSAPVLVASPTSIHVTAVKGNVIAPQILQVINNGGKGSVDVNHSLSWLNLPIGTYQLPPEEVLNLSVGFSSSLPMGTYSGNITIMSLTSYDSLTIPVSLKIIGTYAYPQTDVQSIDITIPQGTNASIIPVKLWNAGAGLGMSFTAADRPLRNNGVPLRFGDLSWLSVTPTSGTVIGGEQVTLSVKFATNGLDVGVYNGSIVITTSKDKAIIPVTIKVSGVAGASEF